MYEYHRLPCSTPCPDQSQGTHLYPELREVSSLLHWNAEVETNGCQDAREAPAGQELEKLETLNEMYSKRENRSTVNISNTECLGAVTRGGRQGRQGPNRLERCAIIVRQCPL